MSFTAHPEPGPLPLGKKNTWRKHKIKPEWNVTAAPLVPQEHIPPGPSLLAVLLLSLLRAILAGLLLLLAALVLLVLVAPMALPFLALVLFAGGGGERRGKASEPAAAQLCHSRDQTHQLCSTGRALDPEQEEAEQQRGALRCRGKVFCSLGMIWHCVQLHLGSRQLWDAPHCSSTPAGQAVHCWECCQGHWGSDLFVYNKQLHIVCVHPTPEGTPIALPYHQFWYKALRLLRKGRVLNLRDAGKLLLFWTCWGKPLARSKRWVDEAERPRFPNGRAGLLLFSHKWPSTSPAMCFKAPLSPPPELVSRCIAGGTDPGSLAQGSNPSPSGWWGGAGDLWAPHCSCSTWQALRSLSVFCYWQVTIWQWFVPHWWFNHLQSNFLDAQ